MVGEIEFNGVRITKSGGANHEAIGGYVLAVFDPSKRIVEGGGLRSRAEPLGPVDRCDGPRPEVEICRGVGFVYDVHLFRDLLSSEMDLNEETGQRSRSGDLREHTPLLRLYLRVVGDNIEVDWNRLPGVAGGPGGEVDVGPF